MKDYRVTVKVRNNRILNAIEEAGGVTGNKWCADNGLSYPMVNGFINMTIGPRDDKTGNFRESALLLCDVLNKLPDELWSNEQLYPLEKNFSEMEMDHSQVMAMLPSSEQSYLPDFSDFENKQKKVLIEKALATLTTRERAVIRMRFEDDLTLEDIGERLDVTQSRVMQIEQKAMRKLRHPNNSSILRDCIEPERRTLKGKA